MSAGSWYANDYLAEVPPQSDLVLQAFEHRSRGVPEGLLPEIDALIQAKAAEVRAAAIRSRGQIVAASDEDEKALRRSRRRGRR